MELDWNAIAYIAAIVVPVAVAGIIFWRWFDSRPHRFKDHDGNAHVWHPVMLNPFSASSDEPP